MTYKLTWRDLLIGAIALTAGYLLSMDARADGKISPPPFGHQQNQNQTQTQNQDGASVSISGSSTFRALALDFPELDGDNCIGGAQGGGDSNGDGAFFGMNFIIDPCYYQKLAMRETNVDTMARLKCADRKYRSAVAYHISRFRSAARRQFCIDRVSSDEYDRIAALREDAAKRLSECTSGRERSDMALRECLSK